MAQKAKGSSKSRAKKPADPGAAAREAAAAGTRAAGKAVATAARQAKVPLVIGGAVVVGAAGGLVARSRRRSNGLARLDFDAVEGAAKRVSTLTGQVADIAGAMNRRAERRG